MGKKWKVIELVEPKTRSPCPFAAEPFEECFIFIIDSQGVELTILYCCENFKECPIYKREIKGSLRMTGMKEALS